MIPTGIVIHCSASPYGDAAEIGRWHTDPKPQGNGWRDIGYHAVVLNGFREYRSRYVLADDGRIEWGRRTDERGAHAIRHNHNTLGACMIGLGDGRYTPRQIDALRSLVGVWRAEFGVSRVRVIGHNDVSRKKCPGFNVGAWYSL